MPKFKELVRMFVAIEISGKSASQLEKLVTVLRACGADIKWVETGLYHVTIKFLGDVDRADMGTVCQAFQQAVAHIAPFEIRALGTGAFPKIEQPRSIWVKIDQGLEELNHLFSIVEDVAIKLGFAPENRPYDPHITLGRVRKPNAALKTLSEKITQFPRYDAGKTYVTRVTVMSSELTRKGPIYVPLANCPLGGIRD